MVLRVWAEASNGGRQFSPRTVPPAESRPPVSGELVSVGRATAHKVGQNGDRQADRPRLALQDDRTFHGWSPGTEKPPGKRR